MTDQQFAAIEYLKNLLTDLWIVTNSNKLLKMDYFDGTDWEGEADITMTPGYYTTAQLQTHLDALIVAGFTACSSVTVAYSSTTNSWTITAGEIDEKVKYVNTGSTGGGLLGFTADQGLLAIISDTQVFPYIHLTGYFPDDVKNLGNRFPAVLLRDGDGEEDLPDSSRRIEQNMDIVAYLYTADQSDRIEKALTLQRIVADNCLIDLTVGSNAIMISPLRVEKGDYSGTLDKYNAGFYPNLTVRKYYFNLMNYDTRSQ